MLSRFLPKSAKPVSQTTPARSGISLVGRGYYKTLLAVNETPEVSACRSADAGLRIDFPQPVSDVHLTLNDYAQPDLKITAFAGAAILIIPVLDKENGDPL